MDHPKKQHPQAQPGMWSQMSRDFSAVFGWLFDLLLGNRQASAQFRLAMLVISYMGIWASLSLILHPALPRVENWQMTESLFKSLFAPDVLGIMLAITLPLNIMLRLAAIYLDDIFELQDVWMATKYILQAAFALRYQVVNIEGGDVAEADKNTPLYKIGGPGYVNVKFENAAVFERSNCAARIIPSDAEGEEIEENHFLPWVVGIIWALAGLATSIYVYYIFLNESPTGLMDWLVQGILEEEPRYVLSAILSIMAGGFIYGIFANIASRIPGGIVGGLFGAIIFGFMAGLLGYVFSGQIGTAVGLAAGMLIIVWRGRFLLQATTIDGFERLRAVIDLREQKKTLRTIRARTRDGIEIIADDVQVIFSVYRPEPLSAFYDEEAPRHLTFSEDAIMRMVYEEGNKPWTENVETALAFTIREEIAGSDLFDLISQSIDEAGAGNYILRDDFYHRVIQKINGRRKEKGFQIEWLGLGTWRTVLPQIEENILEMWKNISTTQQHTSEAQLERLSIEARYDEMKRLYLHPATVLDKFKHREEKGFPPYVQGLSAQGMATTGTGLSGTAPFPAAPAQGNPSADLFKFELLSAYREKMYRAWIIYSDQGKPVPDEIVRALKHINYLLAHKP